MRSSASKRSSTIGKEVISAGSSRSSLNDKSKNVELQKIQEDFNLLSRKIAELSLQPASTGFVSGFRSEVERKGSFCDFDVTSCDFSNNSKLQMLETLISRVVELDRLVLRLTEPPNIDKDGVKLRSARGMDLYSIPTHLHVVDRLLDVHAQYKRNLHSASTQSGGGRPMAGAGVAESVSSADAVKEATDKLRAEQEREIETWRSRNRISQDKSSQLQSKLDQALSEKDEMTRRLQTLSTKVDEKDKDSKELERLRAQVVQQQSSCRTLEESLEASSLNEQNIISELQALAKRFQEREGGPTSPMKFRNVLSGNVAGAMRRLEEAVLSRMTQLRTDRDFANSARVLVEAEMANVSAEREMLSSDLDNLSSQHEALRGAYQALELEAHAVSRKLASTTADNHAMRNMQEALSRAQSELRTNALKLMELPHLEASRKELQDRLTESEFQKGHLRISSS